MKTENMKEISDLEKKFRQSLSPAEIVRVDRASKILYIANRVGPISLLAGTVLGASLIGTTYALAKVEGYVENGYLTSDTPEDLSNLFNYGLLIWTSSFLPYITSFLFGNSATKKVKDYLNKYYTFKKTNNK